ncbi:MAG: rod shape-determining protein MreC [Patescibacteria group bacterium]|jgi:rod shape-determining protein MreC
MGYKNKITKNKIFIFMAVIALLIFLHFLKLTGPLESGLTYIFNPFFSGFYSVSTNIRTRVDEEMGRQELLESLKTMEIERNQLVVDNAKMKGLEDENETLRKYLNFFEETKYQSVMASVVSRFAPAETEGEVMINKGEKEGVAPGLAVIDSQGIIVGKVAAAKEHVSLVNLTTDSRCRLAAAVENSDKTIGVTGGELGLTIKMEYVPQTENLQTGNIVVTSGLEKGIPKGLVIGKISEVRRESNELWQTAVIEPVVNLNELTIVSVLLP